MTRSVRRLHGEDLADFRALRLEALERAPEAFGSSFEEAREQPDSYFRTILERLAVFGGFLDGRLVGLMAFAGRDGVKSRHAGDLIMVYLRPEARGTGLGLELIEAVVDYARGRVIQLQLGVGAENTPAIRLYQKAGFAIYGTEPRALFVNGRYIDEHLMVRFLDKAPGDQE